jgi:hypothetical protein
MWVIVSRRIWSNAGLDSFAKRNDGDVIELNREINFEEVVVESCFR